MTNKYANQFEDVFLNQDSLTELLSDKYIHHILTAEDIDDSVKTAISSGLRKIKQDIGDDDLDAYLQERKDKARQRLFGKT